MNSGINQNIPKPEYSDSPWKTKGTFKQQDYNKSTGDLARKPIQFLKRGSGHQYDPLKAVIEEKEKFQRQNSMTQSNDQLQTSTLTADVNLVTQSVDDITKIRNSQMNSSRGETRPRQMSNNSQFESKIPSIRNNNHISMSLNYGVSGTNEQRRGTQTS